MDPSSLNDSDRQALAKRGISEREAIRQLGMLGRPPLWTRLDRPCTAGDGIRRIDPGEYDGLLAEHREAAGAGRFVKFVPASGAATRMFRELLHYQRGPGRDEKWPEIVARCGEPGSGRAATLVRFVTEIEKFAFFRRLEQTLASRGQDAGVLAGSGDFRPLLDALLDSDGLDYDDLPKGCLAFHRNAAGVTTAFEEHLIEAARYVRRADGTCRLHFTVSEEHRDGFEKLLDRVGPDWAARLDARWDVGWSAQKPSTDTLAVDPEGHPFRDAEGQLVFRPGGHGALIENIADLGGDLVYVKNIDNVQPEHAREPTVLWKRLLGGLLVRIERQVHELIRALDAGSGGVEERVEGFARDVLSIEVKGAADPKSLLHRPIRVCGVVPNTGEPGGGPFWVRGGDGEVRAQIVETAQVDPHDDAQQSILRESTHFNPVDLVCAVRDFGGKPFDLSAYVDEDSSIVTSKSTAGRDLRALERPGLWNGAMAGWTTIFVEVPIETFSPVKSVLDLLRPEHQPPG